MIERGEITRHPSDAGAEDHVILLDWLFLLFLRGAIGHAERLRRNPTKIMQAGGGFKKHKNTFHSTAIFINATNTAHCQLQTQENYFKINFISICVVCDTAHVLEYLIFMYYTPILM